MHSKIFVKIHAVLRKLWSCAQLPMCPIGHVPHHPCAPSPRYPISTFNINHDTPLPMCPIAHVSCCPCAPSPMCPIPQGAPSLSSVLTMIPICPCVPLPTCQKRCQVVKKMSSCQKDVKLSKRCQVVKKMSNVKKSNTWTMEEVHKKINWHNEVHTYWCQFWRHIWWGPKTLKMCIESVFEQFWWPSYLTSKLTWICVWLFDIWHLFDILISLSYFDIFLGGLSLHLNHLIAWRVGISFRQFGTLPIGIFLSNLDSKHLDIS